MQNFFVPAIGPAAGERVRDRSADLVLLALIALAAPAFALATWSVPYQRSPLLDLAIPVIAIEMLLVSLLLLWSNSVLDAARGLDRIAVALCAAWLASSAASMLLAQSDPDAARFHFLLDCLHVAFALALASRLALRADLRIKLVWALAASLGCYAVIVIALAQTVGVDRAFDWASLGAGVTNPRQLAFFALPATGAAGALWLTSRRRAERTSAGAILLAGMTLCLWCGGRGAFGALVCQLLALGILAGARRRAFANTALGCFLGAAALSALLAPPSDLYGPQAVFSRVVSDQPMGYASGRTELWRQAADGFAESPLFGRGQAQFKTEVRATGGTVNHPHNLFLQMLYQWGAVGTLLCAATMLRLLARPRRVAAIRHDAASLAAAAMLAGLGASSMLDGPFFYAYPNLVLAIALALACTAPASRIPVRHEDAA